MRNPRGVQFGVGLMVFFCLTLPGMTQEKGEEEIYAIKQGDTLWGLSSRFMKDPYLWPKLWEQNPYITNPHWIYPGNPIRVSPLEKVKKEEPAKVVVEEKPKEEMAPPATPRTEVWREESPPIE